MFDVLADSSQYGDTAQCHAVQQGLTSSSVSFSPRLVITCRSCRERTARILASLAHVSGCCLAEPQFPSAALRQSASTAVSKAGASIAGKALQHQGCHCKHGPGCCLQHKAGRPASQQCTDCRRMLQPQAAEATAAQGWQAGQQCGDCMRALQHQPAKARGDPCRRLAA